MSAPRFARGSKSRIFLYVGTVLAFVVGVWVIHETQVQLSDSRNAAMKCQQQQESLSAQLQVIFEYKTRLEKSLQEEKALHRKTREELESQIDNEKQVREKDGIEQVNKFTSLQQQYKILQGQHEDLTEDCNKVRQAQVVAAGERSRLESEVAAARQELEQVQAVRDKEVEALKRELAALKKKTGDMSVGIVNKRNVDVVVVDVPSSKKAVSSSPSVPVAAPKAEEDIGKNVLPQPGAAPHQVSSSTTHGSLLMHSATPKGKLAADPGQSNNVIPVPPPQGAQPGAGPEVQASEGVDRVDAQQGVVHAPADGVGARPPDSPHRQEHDKELEHEDELKEKELDHHMEVGDGVGAAPDIMKRSDDNPMDNKEHAYQSHGAGMQWGLAPPAPYEQHQQAVVPLPYAFENHLHQVQHKPYNSDLLQNSILHRDAGHQRMYRQELPKLQPPLALPRSQHDPNSVLQHHPLPLPNRKSVGGYGMKEMERQPVGEEGERAEEEANVARRWHIRDPQRPMGGLFPYHGGGGDYGREEEGDEGEVAEGGKANARVARGHWGVGEHKEAPANAQEDLQLEEGDEDDEDVDQIDYGANEAAGANAGDKEPKHQSLDKMDKKRESVMVNPK
ncbi:Golgi integral membrane protein 4-like isoform X2 [Ischnura elegans]|uniref:Golgi integral membrane protein 4-like isoform X2 n=1 Tax=Ischnura elegans TaxID=197161 RepID=UPI001ED87F95|nr:Golgi integral membrane protein 4-like isoform X2 [Ischnura elegans]